MIRIDIKVNNKSADIYLSTDIYNNKHIDNCDYNDIKCVTQIHQSIAKVANTFNINIDDIEITIDKPNNYTVEKLKEMAFIIRPYTGAYSI